MAEMTVLRLACRPQHYSWGKLGLNSEVAQLLQNSDPKWTIDASTPYAELWMGAHPKADSAIIWDHVENHVEEKTLGTWIQKNPQSLGTKVREKFNDKLPFLFKVLSVRNALSIQAHPDKDLAMQLHARSPQNYPDENHKPEMCIALTSFTGLCGFRPVTEVLDFLSELPELVVLLGPDCVEELRSGLSDLDQTRAALKSCFSKMMRSDKDLVQTQLRTLVQRAEARGPVPLQDLLLELHSQFPGDIGCFCLFFLNLVQLQPGDAMFLKANEIHAYLSGDCVEVMACSDNTVRAGLTPKFLDVETLCEMLDYSPAPPTSKRFPCRRDDHDSHVTLYNPPIDDFSVIRTQVLIPEPMSWQQVSRTESYVIPPLDSGSILLVISGSANCPTHSDIRLGRGSVLFLSANQSLPLEVTSSIDLYRACCLL